MDKSWRLERSNALSRESLLAAKLVQRMSLGTLARAILSFSQHVFGRLQKIYFEFSILKQQHVLFLKRDIVVCVLHH